MDTGQKHMRDRTQGPGNPINRSTTLEPKQNTIAKNTKCCARGSGPRQDHYPAEKLNCSQSDASQMVLQFKVDHNLCTFLC